MANKGNKKVTAVSVDLPECPVCMETMTAPIFQCMSGHSLCNVCTTNLTPPICPICRENMTQIRNWQLEEIVSKAKVSCPNKDYGCVYTVFATEIEDHLKECIFREMDCPAGTAFGKCSWKGKLKDMIDHFKERHPENCNVSSDAEVELNNIDVKQDERFLFLIPQAKFLFVLTVKIDSLQQMAYWAIQHIGAKKVAHSHVYEIHLSSLIEPRRKVVFIEHCFNDAIKPEEVFRQGKCGVLPLDNLKHFIKNKTISFRFFIKRMPAPPNTKNDKGDGKNDGKQNKGPKGPGPKGPGPKGPNAPGFKGQGNNGPGQKGQGNSNVGQKNPNHKFVANKKQNHGKNTD